MYKYTHTCVAAAVVLLCCCIGRTKGYCDHPIYCQGPVLAAVQTAAVFNDSKTFVDLPMKVPPAAVLTAFAKLAVNASMSAFVNDYFYPVNSDLIPVVPTDWVPNPDLFKYIKDSKVKEFANIVNSKWLKLVIKFNDSFCDGCYSHISVPNPFVIAGSRFREFYYWDTYWALDGLLLSGMFQTAYGIIQNFLGLITRFGFIPNGGRIYYLNRSQPPMITQMVQLYHAFNPDFAMLVEALPILDQEYQYWMSNHSVVMSDNKSVLNRFYVVNSSPRPESYLNDVKTAASLSLAAQKNLYMQLATTAETGWDFSTRWMSNPPNMTSLTTTNIIPVDLNCILYANELALADLHEQVGNFDRGAAYRDAAAARLVAIQKYLWNQTSLSWNDYNFATKQQTTTFYAYQFVPFWSGVYETLPHDTISAVLKTVLPMFDYAAGLPTSLDTSGQQWDFPNGWAPLQFWAIQGFQNVMNNPDWQDPVISRQLAAVSNALVKKWITTNYCAYKKYNMIFEKYDVTAIGSTGGGGEYTVQDGFGWTNGVALRFIADNAGTLVMGSCGK